MLHVRVLRSLPALLAVLIWMPDPSSTGVAGWESGVTPSDRLAGFAGARRPRGGRSSTPASFT